ncbi:MAG TPA: fused MFS/spermidine synthase [Patescibacteria group bacterium]|nr:fused MFS/spermidine synthase [Patescibacteria group bacterium]
MATQSKPGGTSVLVFSLTLFLSAALMFSVQPMAGKMLLPLVGGTPAGWIVAMAFFQVMLLAGYLLAHGLSKLGSMAHGAVYVLCLAAGWFFLPVSLTGTMSGSVPEAGRIFILLTQALAVPFIALSATSSTLQRLFMKTRHGKADDPYFLYAASNLGSFSGLLLYPLLIEPRLGLIEQAKYFSAGYSSLILAGLLCLWLARGKDSEQRKVANETVAPLGVKRQVEWLALAFFPSCLLMSVTTYITSDVISAPLIWILPLSLYLFTFVIAFGRSRISSAAAIENLQPYVTCNAIIFISLIGAKWLGSWIGVFFYLAVFTLVALACHIRLASLRPLGNDRHLTAFYLMMSVGGALGGVLNAFIIPLVFSRLIEFPLTLLAAFLIHKQYNLRSRTGLAIAGLLLLSLLLVNAPRPNIGVDIVEGRMLLLQALGLLVIALLVFRRKSLRADVVTLGTLLLFMVVTFILGDRTEIFSVRNFYGTIRLYDVEKIVDGRPETIRYMRHGSTNHGLQVQSDEKLSMIPTAYFTRQGPVGDIYGIFKPAKVAVLGLGVGVMNCYNEPYREFTFFEIDPAVVEVAQDKFTFLSACKSKAPPRLIVGDGRLELARLDEKFDLLFMDAFTSDSIPVHLLTKEALQLYVERLAPGGVIAINVSNRYFALWHAIASTAATLGLKTEMKADLAVERPAYSSASIFLVLTRPADKLSLAAQGWSEVAAVPGIRPWTDDYTSLLGTLTLDVAANGLKQE